MVVWKAKMLRVFGLCLISVLGSGCVVQSGITDQAIAFNKAVAD